MQLTSTARARRVYPRAPRVSLRSHSLAPLNHIAPTRESSSTRIRSNGWAQRRRPATLAAIRFARVRMLQHARASGRRARRCVIRCTENCILHNMKLEMFIQNHKLSSVHIKFEDLSCHALCEITAHKARQNRIINVFAMLDLIFG